VRRLATIFCSAFALFATFPVVAQSDETEWSDAAIWVTVGETYGLERKLRRRIFNAIAVRDEIRRAGVMPACRSIKEFIDRKAEGVGAEYRALIVPAVRTVVPEGKALDERISVSPSFYRLGRMVDQLERQHPDLFGELYASIGTELVPELADLPAIEGEWRGPFDDWNFDGPNQTVWGSACTNATLSNPAEGKAAFDGFFKERATQ
jgi:hypothetical protein